jgi:hypothetical protein
MQKFMGSGIVMAGALKNPLSAPMGTKLFAGFSSGSTPLDHLYGT